MTGEREDRGRRIRPEAALQPPPRPGVPTVPSPGASLPAGPSRGVRSAAVLVASLAVLAAGGAVVFVFLPAWMAGRSQPASVDPRPSAVATPPPSPAAARSPTTEPSSTLAASADDPPPPAPVERTAPGERGGTTVAAPSAPAEPGTDEWKRAMSEGLAALERGALAEAQAALARAEAARPGTSAAADALKRVEEARRTEGLAVHRARAAAAEAREDWKAALAAYEAALKLDPQVAFALEGRARSQPRAELDERLAGYLQRPERLTAEAVAREADRALDRARDVEPAGPRLQEQRAALERLLHEAGTPVDVSFVSDGLTEVVVLRVGTLGTFRDRKVALRPGSYVVLGRRRGYRDARKTLVVTPARVPPPLDVRCVEVM